VGEGLQDTLPVGLRGQGLAEAAAQHRMRLPVTLEGRSNVARCVENGPAGSSVAEGRGAPDAVGRQLIHDIIGERGKQLAPLKVLADQGRAPRRSQHAAER